MERTEQRADRGPTDLPICRVYVIHHWLANITSFIHAAGSRRETNYSDDEKFCSKEGAVPNKVIIEVRINEYAMRDQNPNVPYSPEEISTQALECLA